MAKQPKKPTTTTPTRAPRVTLTKEQRWAAYNEAGGRCHVFGRRIDQEILDAATAESAAQDALDAAKERRRAIGELFAPLLRDKGVLCFAGNRAEVFGEEAAVVEALEA